MMSEGLALLAGVVFASLAPLYIADSQQGANLVCVKDGCQARLEGKGGNPLACAPIEFDLDWHFVNGKCKCPEGACDIDRPVCESVFDMYIWADPSGSGIGINVNGDCGFEENWAFSSSGAPGCGGTGEWQQVVVTQGLCGGSVLCDFSLIAFCRDCRMDC